MPASDSIQTQKDIFGQIQGLLAFLDTTEEKKGRENLEAWKNTLESLREITSNPLPFLLELLKVLKNKILTLSYNLHLSGYSQSSFSYLRLCMQCTAYCMSMIGGFSFLFCCCH